MIEIDLAPLNDAAIILLHSEGAKYAASVYGELAIPVVAQGYFVPAPRGADQLLHALFVRSVSCYLENNMRNELDDLFRRIFSSNSVTVDIDRIAESGYAWVYVRINGLLPGIIDVPIQNEAIICWPNGPVLADAYHAG